MPMIFKICLCSWIVYMVYFIFMRVWVKANYREYVKMKIQGTLGNQPLVLFLGLFTIFNIMLSMVSAIYIVLLL